MNRQWLANDHEYTYWMSFHKRRLLNFSQGAIFSSPCPSIFVFPPLPFPCPFSVSKRPFKSIYALWEQYVNSGSGRAGLSERADLALHGRIQRLWLGASGLARAEAGSGILGRGQLAPSPLAKGSGERCKILQWGSGRSPGSCWFWWGWSFKNVSGITSFACRSRFPTENAFLCEFQPKSL